MHYTQSNGHPVSTQTSQGRSRNITHHWVTRYATTAKNHIKEWIMKKLIAGAILLGASSMAFAQPGCGVGAMIWKGQSGIAPHVLAATTNGTFGNQTFGMTTGTLGCQTNESVQSMALYMDSNIDKVARDMSRGSGENLDTLAVLLGVDAADRDTFRKVLQDNFATIFPSSDTTSGEAVDAIVALLEQNQSLSKYVAA